MPSDAQTLDRLCIDTIRTLSMDAVQAANSGHPGTPMALAPLAYVIWTRHLKHNPADTAWADRDRFILSAGHASMLLYSMLYLTGYGLTLDERKTVVEALLALKRAGADAILTYYAKTAAQWLRDSRP